MIISRDFYASITDKYNTDAEPQYMLFERKGTPHFTIWPIPSSTSPDLVIHYHRVRRLEDLDNAGDNADVLEPWINALAYALAAELADEYGLSPYDRNRLTALADSKLGRLIRGDRDIEDAVTMRSAYVPTGSRSGKTKNLDMDDYGDR
jgi:hypothetical protein